MRAAAGTDASRRASSSTSASGGGSVQVAHRVGQRRHAELVAHVVRQQFRRRRPGISAQRLVGEVAQPSLLHALGRRIDRRQAIADRGCWSSRSSGTRGGSSPAALDPCGPRRNSSAGRRAGTAPAAAREVEEAQRELAGAVADATSRLRRPRYTVSASSTSPRRGSDRRHAARRSGTSACGLRSAAAAGTAGPRRGTDAEALELFRRAPGRRRASASSAFDCSCARRHSCHGRPDGATRTRRCGVVTAPRIASASTSTAFRQRRDAHRGARRVRLVEILGHHAR